MREDDGPPKVYTHEDLQRLIKGSERANQMKREIGLVLGILTKAIGKFHRTSDTSRTDYICSAPVSLHGVDYRLRICRPNSGITGRIRDLEVRLTRKDELIFENIAADNVDQLPLRFVKPIYDALPDLMTAAFTVSLDATRLMEDLMEFEDFMRRETQKT